MLEENLKFVISELISSKGVKQTFISKSCKIENSLLCRWLKDERKLNDNQILNLHKFIKQYVESINLITSKATN